MKRTIWIALLLMGCAAREPEPVFIGKPLSAVVAKMGYPQSQREFEGDTVYSWTSSYLKARFIFIHSRETCTMDVGTRDGLVKSIHYNGDGGPCGALESTLMER
jgi:hypothetical protein